MHAQYTDAPWWAVVTIWAVVNAVNTLQGIGFLSRVRTGAMTVNHYIGFAIMLLAVPALIALAGFIREGSNRIHIIGPVIFLAFIALLVIVDYIRPVEFRSPARPEILVPFLVLFFGGILFMGLPMFRINRQLWFVTAATTVFHLVSMSIAMRSGVG